MNHRVFSLTCALTLAACGGLPSHELELAADEVVSRDAEAGRALDCDDGARCAVMLCRPGTFCVEDADGLGRCETYPTCASAEIACAPGTHCEDLEIRCFRAPCAPTAPSCVPDTPPRGCAVVRCAAGTYCVEQNGRASCEWYPTCAWGHCAPGQRCEDRPIQCVRAPCPPTAPVCT
jgi:hypothetical protein